MTIVLKRILSVLLVTCISSSISWYLYGIIVGFGDPSERSAEHFNISKLQMIQSREWTRLPPPQDCDIIYRNKSEYRVKIDRVEYPKQKLYHQNSTINFECLNKNSRDTKVILFGNSRPTDEFFGYRYGKVAPFIKNRCPVTNCELTQVKKYNHLSLF